MQDTGAGMNLEVSDMSPALFARLEFAEQVELLVRSKEDEERRKEKKTRAFERDLGRGAIGRVGSDF